MRFFNGKKRIIDILNDFSDYVTVFQLFDTAGNFNNDVSITECWIYDSNYKIALPLMKKSLDIILIRTNIRRECILNLKMFTMQLVM